MLEKTLENLLDCKEIKPVNRKGNQSLIFIGRTDVEAETPVLWPSDAKSFLIECGPLEKGMANHFTILAWKISRMEEPGRLRSMGSQRMEHD